MLLASLSVRLAMSRPLSEDRRAMGLYTPKRETARERRWTDSHRLLVYYEHISG